MSTSAGATGLNGREQGKTRGKMTHSYPVPLEPDSDSDFNPAEIYVPTPKKRGRRSALTSAPVRSKRKRCDVLEKMSGVERSGKKVKMVDSPVLQLHNQFVKHFVDVDIESESEGGDADKEFDDEDGDEREDEDEEEEEEDHTVVKTLFPSSHRTNITPSLSPAVPPPETQSQDSVTDSETDPESDDPTLTMPKPPQTGSKRKSPPAPTGPPIKKTRFAEPEAEEVSVTEPESDDSVTDPESDDDMPCNTYRPRPDFARKPDQPWIAPLYLDKDKGIKVPGSINTFLRDYQRDGIRFFWERYAARRGGLLGDDMGLGKTIQVISFLSAIMHKYGDNRDENRRKDHVSSLQDGQDWKKRRHLPQANDKWPTCLIIAPSSVVHNWEREFETWGYFEVGIYTGTKREEVLKDFRLGRLDVVVTSFETARSDINLIDDLAWSCIIVDEAHRLKNSRSKSSLAYTQFQCPIRFGLSGTVIQNKYSEMWTILDWAYPGCVGSRKQWATYVDKPLTKGQSKSASPEERVRAALVARILRDKVLPDHFLRRTKSIIKDQLPEKIDEVVFCPLAPTQIRVYQRIINSEPVQNMIRKDEPCDCGSRKLRKQCCHKPGQGDLFRYLTTLIKASNHLALILPAPTDNAEQTARNRELSELAFGDDIPKYGTAVLNPNFCGKWLVLESLLKSWRKDPTSKVLIFTKSVRLLDMLDFHLKSQGLGFLKLEGSTPPPQRMPMIDQFHSDPNIFIFLISTLAGGTGLNLTGANKVVIFDPNWNPAHDLQAMDRAYRFGQTRDVSVYRLLGAGSIEELIYARQLYKQQQMAVGYNASLQTRYFEGVQGDKDRQGELFGVKNIFKLHKGNATKMAIERATLIDLDWAFANMKAKPNSDLTLDVDVKGAGKELGEFKGLDTLLFDDSPAEVEETNDVQKMLNEIGIGYTHRNDELIKSNAIEELRVEALIEEKKKARQAQRAKTTTSGTRKKKTQKAEEPAEVWPPKRKHHKKPMTPQAKLMARRGAMIELGLIEDESQMAKFAQEFMTKTAEEQTAILARLDRHAQKR
ncbi:P-loop containing nucleoside triphosphate hydrolase protein [Cristinia sonorae]|uniref:P-loop containing nucleoside triphosphate hydrolase protein n=1 Tax=Cristinia sonorae TaxID=1940300 RepID=A0A8K0UPW0_9AGAR|nr:P-loop containing nucleoside triphosphate hydrolase protein [Cristinia sonorae]